VGHDHRGRRISRPDRRRGAGDRARLALDLLGQPPGGRRDRGRSGFRLAFVITAALWAAALWAAAIVRSEGRGEKINLAEVTLAGIET